MLSGDEDLDPTLEEELAVRRRGRARSASRCRSSTTRTSRSRRSTSIFIDECHRSIYNLWRQVLEYFDAFLIGLTATPTQADLRLLQPEPRHGVRPRAGRRRRRQRRLRRLPHPDRRSPRAARRSRPSFVRRQARPPTRAGALGAARRRSDLRRQPARPRRRRRGPDPHRRPHLPGQALHRDLPRPHRGAEDARLRQGRQPRRRHRPDRARGVRQGQRLLPEDHLPHDRGEARGPARRRSATATTRASPSPWT